MYFESPFEKLLREAREREQKKNNVLRAALLAQGGFSSPNTTTIFNPFLQALLGQQKRKVFISFHHKNDQMWFDHFTKKFSDQYDVFSDKSIGETKGFTTRNQERMRKNWRNALKLCKLLRHKFYVKTVFEINVKKIF